jgi:hypothetical protein
MGLPTKGKFCKLLVDSNAYPFVNWSFPIDAGIEDYSNFRDGRAVTPTLENATLTASLVNDDSFNYVGTSTFRPGAYGTWTLYTNNAQTKFLRAVMCIGQFTPNVSGQNATLRGDVSCSLHGTIDYANA